MLYTVARIKTGTDTYVRVKLTPTTSFIAAQREAIKLEAEITQRSGYPATIRMLE